MTMQPSRPATAAEIAGRLDDELLGRIIATGAIPAEVLEAFTWANADDQIGTELQRRPRGAAAQVYELLKEAEPEADDALDGTSLPARGPNAPPSSSSLAVLISWSSPGCSPAAGQSSNAVQLQ
jgi:hypothetical protein